MLELYKNMKWKNEKINRLNISIPEEWEINKVKGISELKQGKIKKFQNIKKYISTKCIKNNSIVKIEKEITYNNRPSRANIEPILNSIMLAKMKNTSKCIYINDNNIINNFIFSTGFFQIQIKKEYIPKYFYYYFQNQNFEYIKNLNSFGTTQEAINDKQFQNLQLHYPSSIEEQENIVKVLDEQETRINNIDKQINNYKDLLKYYQKELLSGNIRLKLKEKKLEELKNKQIIDENNNILNIENFNDIITLKDIELYKNTKWKNEKINRIDINRPKDWKVSKIKDISKLKQGKIKKFLNVKKYISTKCVQNNEIKKIEQEITYNNRPSRANIVPILNSIMLAKMKNTSKCLYINNKNIVNNYIFSTGFFQIQIVKENISKYFYYYFQSKNFEYIKNLNSLGTTQEAINNKQFNNLQLYYPSSKLEQGLIVKYLDNIEQQLKTLKDLKELEEKKFKYLQSKLLSGEIRIKPTN